jgi:chaperonin GroES
VTAVRISLAAPFIFEDIMNIKPLHDKILIERLETIKETSSGIILRHSEEPDKAKVLAVGPDVNEVQVGDTVQPDWGKTVKSESSEKTFLVKIEDIAYIYGE